MGDTPVMCWKSRNWTEKTVSMKEKSMSRLKKGEV